ncbi:spermidine synthase [Paludisphaera soli]|uniref:spermidine synthase n=1 Tax=Paludisphaera soli TaxID=2712865 RepID=UPI0013EB5E54|nr:spermidine synthase [Paludisphaera soli]
MNPTGFEVLAYEPTDLGVLCLRRRATLSEPVVIVTEVTLDHQFLMSSLHTASERALATVALEMHDGEALDVLVGGLGLGYTAHAALGSSRVARVEVVEYLPQVVDWLRRGWFPLSGELTADPRLVVGPGDVYARIQSAPTRLYDLILIDVDHSPDDTLAGPNASFYDLPGLESAREHLAPGGVLAVWSYAESSPFADALRATFREVRVERVAYWNRHADEECVDWLFFARK